MRWRGGVAAAGAALVAVMVWASWPVSPAGYRQVLSGAAQDALSAAGTAMLVAQANGAGDLVGPYTATALDENREAVATATQSVLAQAVPDEASAQLRAELIPLLIAASDSIAAVQSAVNEADPDQVNQAAATLAPIQDRLEQFVTDTA
jgi:hypothetical protein